MRTLDSRQAVVDDLLAAAAAAVTNPDRLLRLSQLHWVMTAPTAEPGTPPRWAEVCRPGDSAALTRWYAWALTGFTATWHLPVGDATRDQAGEIWALAQLAVGHHSAAIDVLTGLLTDADDTVTLRRRQILAVALHTIGACDRALTQMWRTWQAWQHQHNADTGLGMRLLGSYQTLLLACGQPLAAHRLLDQAATMRLPVTELTDSTFSTAADAAIAAHQTVCARPDIATAAAYRELVRR